MLGTVAIQAQTEKKYINGTIVDSEGQNLIGANIYWEGTQTATSSNKNGEYQLEPPQDYPQILVISFVGFQTKKVEVSELGKYKIQLSESIELKEVSVEAKVSTTELSMINPLQSQKISSKELQKAACCNLSESFETNATVDVTFSDAISGAKQIKMLGLDGVYTQITQENVPLIRGLSSTYGLSHVPGTWIESIQIIKGPGSVVNGFESFAGQINLELFKPQNSEGLFWNTYVNAEAKVENNLQIAKRHGDWKSVLFTSLAYYDAEVDNNDDNFLDVTHLKYYNLLNKWQYDGSDNFNFSAFANVLSEEREGGQLESSSNPYLVDIDNTILVAGTKFGLLQPSEPNKSIGTQTSFKRHEQKAVFGNNDFKGIQESVYLNLIRQTYISNYDHALLYGLSYFGDRFTQSLNGKNFDRLDLVSGFFSEYTFSPIDDFTLVTGFRGDYHHQLGMHYLPRLNAKYNPSDDMVVRLSAGKSYRFPNVISENLSYLASNRNIEISNEFIAEQAWNYGVNFTYCFLLFDRGATFSADAFRTEFQNQVVIDIEDQFTLRAYNLEGESYSNSVQFDLSYELLERVDVKVAYKINKVYTTFDGVIKLSPLVPQDRALFNIAYSTDHINKWMFDFTSNYIGESRIPEHKLIDQDFSESFEIFNAQITKKINQFDIYLGGENLFDYKQEDPILGSDDPFGDNFDASLIWAPVMGRLIYAGFRFNL